MVTKRIVFSMYTIALDDEDQCSVCYRALVCSVQINAL